MARVHRAIVSSVLISLLILPSFANAGILAFLIQNTTLIVAQRVVNHVVGVGPGDRPASIDEVFWLAEQKQKADELQRIYSNLQTFKPLYDFYRSEIEAPSNDLNSRALRNLAIDVSRVDGDPIRQNLSVEAAVNWYLEKERQALIGEMRLEKPEGFSNQDLDRIAANENSRPKNAKRGPFVLIHETGAKGTIVIVPPFRDEPYDVRDMAREKFKSGYNVIVPRLPGHGSRPWAMLNENVVKAERWLQSVVNALALARQLHVPVHGIGISLGGLLLSYIDRNGAAIGLPRDKFQFADLTLIGPAFALNAGAISGRLGADRFTRILLLTMSSLRSESRKFSKTYELIERLMDRSRSLASDLQTLTRPETIRWLSSMVDYLLERPALTPRNVSILDIQQAHEILSMHGEQIAGAAEFLRAISDGMSNSLGTTMRQAVGTNPEKLFALATRAFPALPTVNGSIEVLKLAVAHQAVGEIRTGTPIRYFTANRDRVVSNREIERQASVSGGEVIPLDGEHADLAKMFVRHETSGGRSSRRGPLTGCEAAFL